MHLFRKLADYYAFGSGEKTNPDADLLWPLYDSLAEAFTPLTDDEGDAAIEKPDVEQTSEKVEPIVQVVEKTVYTKDTAEIEKLYNMILAGQSLEDEFESGMIKDFNDLLEVERNQKDNKINDLFKQLQEYEQEEQKSAAAFGDKFEEMDSSMTKMYDRMQGDQTRLSRMEEMMKSVI